MSTATCTALSAKQLHALEHGYLRALCCIDLYRLQAGAEGSGLAVLQYAATQGLDWTEYEELREWLEKKGIE